MNFKLFSSQNPTYRDYTDWLISRLTIILLIICAVCIGLKQYAGSPIQCHCPDEFKESWCQYAHEHCFMENTYYLPMTDPFEFGNGTARKYAYYQWAPYFLLAQAFWLWIPSMLWQGWSSRLGANVGSVLKSSEILHSGKIDNVRHQELATQVSNYIRHNFGRKCCSTFVFIMTKVFTLIVIFIQMCGVGYLMVGIEEPGEYLQWTANSIQYFPLLQICDYEVHVLSDIHHHTIQCAISINELNRKVFAGIHCWMIILFFIQLINLLYWLFVIVCPCIRTNMKNYGRQTSNGAFKPRLGCDGYLVLRFVGDAVSEVTAGELSEVNGEQASWEPSSQPALDEEYQPLLEEASMPESPGPLYKETVLVKIPPPAPTLEDGNTLPNPVKL